MYGQTSRSPPPTGPPLQHPVPTHPAYIPEPPTTPISPQGYQRYTSSPPASAPTSGFSQHPQRQNTGSSAFLAPGGNGYGGGSPPQGFHQQPAAGSSFIGSGAGAGGGQHQQEGFGYPQFQSFGVQGMMNPAAAQQQQQQPGQKGFGAPDFSAWGVNPATAQFGMALGQNAMAAGQEYMQKNFGGHIPLTALKHHFAVSNSYVMQKLQLLIFPWRRKYRWARRVTRNEQGHAEWQTPREDLNSPDLYIPVMAFVTYVLLAAVQRGLQERFHPEVLGTTASLALAVVLIDAILVKAGCYILNIQGPSQMLDLVAYVGYKFVGVIIVVTASLLKMTGLMFTLVFAYAFFSQAFFILRSLRSVVLPDPANSPASVGMVSNAARSRRIMFLFMVAGSQLFYMGILVRV